MTSVTLDRTTTAPAPVRSKFRKRRLALNSAGIAVAGGAAWCGREWWTTGRFFVSTDDAYVGGEVTVIAPRIVGFITEVAVTDIRRSTPVTC